MKEEQRKSILLEAVKRFRQQEWFRDAVVYDSHPLTGSPTLEIKVNYIPIFERRQVMEFAQSVGLVEKFTIVDRNGKVVE